MVTEVIPRHQLEIAKGQQLAWDLRVLAPEWVRVTSAALAGATSVNIQPSQFAFASGDRLLIGRNQIVQVNGSVAAGAVSVPVTSLTAPIPSSTFMQKIRNVTGYDVKLDATINPEDAASLPGFPINGSVDAAPETGIIHFLATAAVTGALTIGDYYGAFWNRGSGSERPIAEADIKVVARGFTP